MTEIVYVLTNEAMPGLVKIGCTQSDLASRVRSLFQTGVPLPFEVYYACEVSGSSLLLLLRLCIAPERVRAALLIGAKTEIKIGEEIFENLPDTTETASEVKAEVEAGQAKRTIQVLDALELSREQRSSLSVTRQSFAGRSMKITKSSTSARCFH